MTFDVGTITDLLEAVLPILVVIMVMKVLFKSLGEIA
jgi:hypothetical protein